MQTEEVQKAIEALEEVKARQLAGQQLDPWVEESDVVLLARRYGLCRVEDGPELTCAGQQFLDVDGLVDHSVLAFVPVVDDLVARAALMCAGRELLKSFADALRCGDGVSFAGALVPEAFEPQVDEEFSFRLYAACAGLCTSLALGELPSCLVEEMILIALVGLAQSILEEDGHEGGETLGRLIEALGDRDALSLHQAKEPADAALMSQEESGADLRFEAWFEPMWNRAPIGHLGYSSTSPNANSTS